MPKHLCSRAKELVASVIHFFEQERDNGGPLLPLNAVRERTAAALNINISTVSSISQAVKCNEALSSPKKKRPRTKRVTNTASLDVTAIRNSVYEMYEKKEVVTLCMLHKKLQERQLFQGCQKSLHTLLLEIGFKWSKDNPRRGLMELPDIAFKRIKFLRSYITAKTEALYQFVFVDETWIFQNGTVGRSWQDDNKRSVKTTKVDGKRYIVVNAGNENGFIPGAEVLFASKTQTNDYHGEMNQKSFCKWFQNQLLPNLQQPSMIILDNAPYHNTLTTKIPNSSWTKSAIQEWLTSRRIEYPVHCLKPELLEIVAQNKPPKIFLLDEMAEQFGHRVLRLPPYHCIFNAIEMVWGITKKYYNTHIGRDGKTGEACLNMWREALATVTPEIWKNCIRHTNSEIMKWYERERAMDCEDIAPIIINVTAEDSDDTDSN